MLDRRKAITSARLKRPLKRLVSCGTCKACTSSECGECINCLDKLKFGGQGVRKQCCINRRCLKLKQNVASQREMQSPSDAGSGSEELEDDKLSKSEHRLFWTAVAGCMKLNNAEAPGAEEVESMNLPPRDSSSPTSSISTDDDSLALERPQGSELSDESGFCSKLATLLASNGTLASKPIAVRLMANSPSPAWVEMLKSAQEKNQLRAVMPPGLDVT